MNYPDPRFDNFHPYLSPDPWADFYDDIGQRWSSVIGTAVITHIFLFFVISSNFIVPTLKPEEPEPIPVQIVTFGPAETKVEPVPVPQPPAPPPIAAAPPPAQAPRVKPAPPPPPAPIPAPEPIPEPAPEPIPEPVPAPVPEPIPEPEIIDTPPPPPPPPDILANEASPDPVAEPEPLPEPDPLPEPLPEPIPLPEPEPLPEPLPEPIPEPLPEPLPPQPEIEIFDTPIPPPPLPVPEPEPLPEPTPLPEPEILEPDEPLVNIPTEAPEAQPGLATEIPETVIPEPEPAPIIPEPETEPKPEIIQPETPITQEPAPLDAITPEEILPEEEDEIIITTAPTILASPDAPSTQEEEKRAVPQSQAAPVIRPQGGEPAPIGAGGGQPQSGNTRPAARTPSGGTRRPTPGANGWTLNTGGAQSPGAGYEGLNLDIRCREENRTHEDCPEYVQQNPGRSTDGFESFTPHRNTARPAPPPRRNSARDLTIGGVDTTSSISDAQSFLDSAGFSGNEQGQSGNQAPARRVRDFLNNQPEAPAWQLNQPDLTLPPTNEAIGQTLPPANGAIGQRLPSSGAVNNSNNWILRQPIPAESDADEEKEDDEDEVIRLPQQP